MTYDPKTYAKKAPAPAISTEALLDEALAETFPASDPIAVHRIEVREAPNPDDRDEHKERRTVRRKRPAGKKKKTPARKARSKKKAGKKKTTRRPTKNQKKKRSR
jgi:hypothetical protein